MYKASEKSDQGTLVPEIAIIQYNSKLTCKWCGGGGERLAKYQLRSWQETSGRFKVNNLKRV